MANNSMKKTIFWLFWTISPKRMSLMIWLGAYFQAQTLGHTSRQLQAFMYIFGSIWGCPNSQKLHTKKLFSYCLGIFRLKEWA
jgi:hypothetical protein